MRNKKVIGSIAWCPEGHDERADISIKHFDNVLSSFDSNKEIASQIIVDCNVQHPRLQAYLKEIASNPLVTIYRFDEDIGFARSRNFIIDRYLEDISNQFLVFVDSDVIFDDPMWIDKCASFHKDNPVICSFSLDEIPENRSVDNKPDFYSGYSDAIGGHKIHAWEIIKSPVHFVHTKVLELVGGYIVEEFQNIHIIKEEFGDRIRRAGFISVSKGMHVHFELPIQELHPLQYEEKEKKERQLRKNYETDIYKTRKEDIKTGILRPYYDYKIDKVPLKME